MLLQAVLSPACSAGGCAGTAATDVCNLQHEMLQPCMSLSASVLPGAACQVYLQHLTGLLQLAVVSIWVQQLQLHGYGISMATGVIIWGLAFQQGLGWNGLLSLQAPHSSLLLTCEVRLQAVAVTAESRTPLVSCFQQHTMQHCSSQAGEGGDSPAATATSQGGAGAN